MSKPTFKESYDKIVQAYYDEKIEPENTDFCFCGTLHNNSSKWYRSACEFHNDTAFYSGKELVRMESALLNTMTTELTEFSDWSELNASWGDLGEYRNNPIYEEALFKGMCAAVEELKKIHIERGENIDEQFLTKRKLHEQQ